MTVLELSCELRCPEVVYEIIAKTMIERTTVMLSAMTSAMPSSCRSRPLMARP
jgi:hypothetical protein